MKIKAKTCNLHKEILQNIKCPGSDLECPIVQRLTFTEIEAKSSTFLFLNLSNVATVSPLKKNQIKLKKT